MKINSIYIIFTAFTVSLFLFSSPALEHLRKEIKKEMREVIAKTTFDTKNLIQFNEKELKNAIWKENSEFSLNGHLYDVVFHKTIKKQKIYFCLSDGKETLVEKTHQFITSLYRTRKENNIYSWPKIQSLKTQNHFAETHSKTEEKNTFSITKIPDNYFYLETLPSHPIFPKYSPPEHNC